MAVSSWEYIQIMDIMALSGSEGDEFEILSLDYVGKF
jgi:hypothetical protein